MSVGWFRGVERSGMYAKSIVLLSLRWERWRDVLSVRVGWEGLLRRLVKVFGLKMVCSLRVLM